VPERGGAFHPGPLNSRLNVLCGPSPSQKEKVATNEKVARKVKAARNEHTGGNERIVATLPDNQKSWAWDSRIHAQLTSLQ